MWCLPKHTFDFLGMLARYLLVKWGKVGEMGVQKWQTPLPLWSFRGHMTIFTHRFWGIPHLQSLATGDGTMNDDGNFLIASSKVPDSTFKSNTISQSLVDLFNNSRKTYPLVLTGQWKIIHSDIFRHIRVNNNNSLTWNKAIWAWFPLLTMIPVRENSEVVIIYPHIFRYIKMTPILPLKIEIFCHVKWSDHHGWHSVAPYWVLTPLGCCESPARPGRHGPMAHWGSVVYHITLWWTNIALENGQRNSGFSHSKWWFFHCYVSSPEGKLYG